MLKKKQSDARNDHPTACPAPSLPWALVSPSPAAWGVPPGALQPPPPLAPSSGSRGVISHPLPTAADRPQGCALTPGKGLSPHWATGQPPQTPCMHLCVLTPPPWGGHPADSQTPPASSPTGWHPPGSGSHRCLTTPLQPPPSCQRTHPHRLALGWQKGPSCQPHPQPPSSTMSSSCDCRGGLV